MTHKSEQDEYLEQLWYMKESGETEISVLKKAMNGQFDPKRVEELSLSGVVDFHPEAKTIKLTVDGEGRARQLIRAHRLAERLIVDVLGGEEYEKIACEFEHTVSSELVDSICTLLGHPKKCPHGTPIPEGECCRLASKTALSFIMPLAELKPGESARIAYINCRNDQQLHKLDGLCVRPGVVIKLHQNYPTYVIECEGASIALDKEVAGNISVWKNSQQLEEAVTNKIPERRKRFNRFKRIIRLLFINSTKKPV